MSLGTTCGIGSSFRKHFVMQKANSLFMIIEDIGALLILNILQGLFGIL